MQAQRRKSLEMELLSDPRYSALSLTLEASFFPLVLHYKHACIWTRSMELHHKLIHTVSDWIASANLLLTTNRWRFSREQTFIIGKVLLSHLQWQGLNIKAGSQGEVCMEGSTPDLILHFMGTRFISARNIDYVICTMLKSHRIE